jgi:hypothetical protein
MRAAGAAVNAAQAALNHAQIKRDESLYHPVIGKAVIVHEVKLYMKSVWE